MDTHEQFRESERRTFPIRAGAVGIMLLAAALASPSVTSLSRAAILAATYAGMLGVIRVALLPRFRSDAWIFAMLAADGAFAFAALIAFGPLSPALAFPVFMTGYYALFLEFRGAASAAALGFAAASAAALLTGADAALSAATAFSLLAGVAGIAGFLGKERFAERDRRQRASESLQDEMRARKILAAIPSVAAARDEDEWSRAVVGAIRAVAGAPGALVFLRPSGRAGLGLGAASIGNEKHIPKPVERAFLAHDGPCLRALRDGATVFATEAEISRWRLDHSVESAIAAPISTNVRTVGVAVVLTAGARPPSLQVVERIEFLLRVAARFLPETRPSAGLAKADRLTRELEEAGRAQAPASKPPISLGSLTLDPARDDSAVAGVRVSLSRTEFDILYTLARSPDAVVDPDALVRRAWGKSPPSSGVDVTIHRLRRKLARVPHGKHIIKTVRGKGYKLVPPGKG